MMNRRIYLFCWLCLACWLKPVSAEEQALLVIPEPGEKTLIHSDWYARKANEVKMDGNRLSAAPLDKTGWFPARVPGTVLTTLLENHMYPAPEFGLNNNLIPDIHEVGNDFYTYWFTRQFTINNLPEGRNVWLNFRGINYKAEIFLNGKRINRNTHEGMFLRKTFNITPYLRTDAPNVLAVLVYPPTHAGNPNGGQGGDGQIARNNTMQYTPGWDWIQPVRDRNTGIWDEVSITTTGPVCLSSPYVVTKVPGVRDPETKTQREAFVNTSVELENTGSTSLKGLLVCETNGTRLTQPITLSPFEKKTVSLNPLAVKNPRLWWPNGIGEQPLYDMNLSFEIGNQVSDRERLRYGIREITSDKCPDNGGRRFFVNGQKIYVTGGNYINSDWLLRLSPERRWEYPDNHDLFIASVEDQVKMIRNHPSLCFWCGANEWPLAKDIDQCLRKEVFPQLDPERLFVSFSTDTLFTRNYLGDNGDGPYGIQEPEWFFSFRSHPFNPEAGSVGSPEVESMREMMTEQDLAGFPRKGFTRNYTWRYHKDLGYGDHLERYGEVKDIETYCKYAQVVNYDQYRSFMEGWASHMWDWYTGILIWKTQNPWTSLRGQMYDWSLDVNASLYGTRKGCEPLHAYYNPVTRKAGLLNTTLKDYTDLSIIARIYNLEGKLLWEKETRANSKANTVQELLDIPVPEGIQGAYFLRLALNADVPNIYWLTTEPKDYTSLSQLPKSRPDIKTDIKKEGSNFVGTVRLSADSQISFFNRIKVFDRETGKRILPVHYSDNYITLMPGDQQEISLEFPANLPEERIQIVVDSYNSPLP